VLVAQADRADDHLVDALTAAGLDVEAVTAYRTRLRAPTWRERAAVASADAMSFASGSAVEAWVAAMGSTTPPVAAAIGPSTAAVAERMGVKITHTAADHDVEGLVTVICAALVRPS
jgi:uroporphyrinogen-III synthase